MPIWLDKMIPRRVINGAELTQNLLIECEPILLKYNYEIIQFNILKKREILFSAKRQQQPWKIRRSG